MTYSLLHTKRRKPAELRIHCDEVGRGPLAGPVTVGCALAIGKSDLTPYKDSKQLSKKQREKRYMQIKNQSSSCTIAMLHPTPSPLRRLKGGLDTSDRACLPDRQGLGGGVLPVASSRPRSSAGPALETSGSSAKPGSPVASRQPRSSAGSSAKPGLLTSTGRASAEEIDTHGIIHAINLACRRGIGQLLKIYYEQILREQLLQSELGEDILAVRQYDRLFSKEITEHTVLERQSVPNSYATIPGLVRDGNHTFGLDQLLNIPVVTIIKGDQKNRLISVASIVAKVERDAYMTHIAQEFPAYELAKHKGYGTKFHRDAIATHGLSPLHRASFCKNISLPHSPNSLSTTSAFSTTSASENFGTFGTFGKPSLLLHICCAPDLTRPLRWLKDHFKLYLFRYNPNIHPRQEHDQRYAQFIKLVGLEPGDYEILEDRYDPQEFFHAMVDHKESIDPTLKNATKKQILTQASRMEEWSDRCNPCYSSRFLMAAKMAAQHHIPYFSSTLLISPKKIAQKLYQRGKDAQEHYPTTTFLRFDFAKHGGYQKAVELTRAHDLRRQNYCGCGRSLPKPGEKRKAYRGG